MTVTVEIPDYVAPDRVFPFDLYDRDHDPRLVDDLHNGLRYLLKEAPPVFWTPYNGGHWIVTRSDLIAEVLRDHERFSSERMDLPRSSQPFTAIPLNLNPPEHTAYRIALARYFSPKRIMEMEPKIRACTRELIDAVKSQGHCDFVSSIAVPLPVTIFMGMMGWPQERYKEFRALVDALFSGPSDEERGRIVQTILQEVTAMIVDRQSNPRDDLMTHFLGDKVNGRVLRLEEVISMCFFLFAAGLDTVANTASFLFRYLGRSPAIQERLASDPASIEDFIDEGLRAAGVVNTLRLVAKKTQLDGVEMQPEDIVVVMLPLVGMDDRMHRHPEIFDLDRESRENMIFGTGAHLCLGRHLARLELRVLAEEWVHTIPSFSVSSKQRNAFRLGAVMALKDLPLVWPRESGAMTTA